MKRISTLIALTLITLASLAQGWPAHYQGVMLQGFYWDSYTDTKWTTLASQADELSKSFRLIWVPNSGNCNHTPDMGYMPAYWFDHNSSFGKENELRQMISTFKAKGTGIIEDVVINHKNGINSWCDFATESYNGKTLNWSLSDICRNDEAAQNGFNVSGANDTGENFDGCRDLDHTSSNVQNNIKVYLDYLLNDLGYAGFRYDMVKGYAPQYTQIYNQSAQPTYSVGEFWDGSYDQVAGWIRGTGYTSAAFDFPLKYIINDAFGSGNWSALVNKGLAGDPNISRYAVTFVDNHDTYRNNDVLRNNVLAANAFILALPGTPCIFLPHWKAYKTELQKMIRARNAAGINNQSTIVKQQTYNGGYVTVVQGTVGQVMVMSGYVTDADTKGYKLISTGTAQNPNYAFYVSDNVQVDLTDIPQTDPETDTPSEVQNSLQLYVKADAAPYLYAWTTTNTTLNGAWPGQLMTATVTVSDKQWYTAQWEEAPVNIIIHNGQGGSGNQTADINNLSGTVYLEYNGTNGYTNVTTAMQLASCVTYVENHPFAYFEAPSGWDLAFVWAWNNADNYTESGVWPGDVIEKVGTAANGNAIYRWTYSGSLTNQPTNIIFSNGNGTQSADLTFVNGGYYYISSATPAAVVKAPETTVVEHLTLRAAGTQVVYNLNGQKVGTMNEAYKIPKGIYVVEGKKWIKQ